jgi:site-specific DNA-methyltransferase (adenine-specific)
MSGEKSRQFKKVFDFNGRNPDVLNSIANLSNDEVFTPPEFANQMLDTLEKAWADSNEGENIWANSQVRFLDPFTKSGVFLREIAVRLIDGLADEFPDLQERVAHILTRQVFGIATTRLTALMARRTLYCSKKANGKYSITNKFNDENGNIWFEPLEHTWIGGKIKEISMDEDGNEIEVTKDGRCKYCSAPKMQFGNDGVELHAYGLLHKENPKDWVGEIFGEEMKFDVIIGNPPYQLAGGAGGSSDSSIYHKFVEQAQKLEPRYLSMVIPSRWMAGGRGMDDFRRQMLSGGQIVELHDFPISKEVFPGVDVKGGICHFLWDGNYRGDTEYSITRGDQKHGPVRRKLDEFDVFVRNDKAVDILRKVQSHEEESITNILTGDTPFGLATNYKDYSEKKNDDSIALFYISRGKRGVGYIPRQIISKNENLIDSWKILAPEAGSDGGQKIPDYVLGKPTICPPPSACTQSYLAFWVSSEAEAVNLKGYYLTRFFRFLVSLRKITQHALKSTYLWVPVQDFSRTWTDSDLFAKYSLEPSEVAFIESQIQEIKD